MSPSPGQQEKQSSGARDVYVDENAVKVVEEEKKRADKDPLIGLNDFTGDVPETHITNAMTRLPGFPARKQDGELVDIVRKEGTASNTTVKLIGADGEEYGEDAEGLLIPWKDTMAGSAEASKNVQAPYGMTQKVAEAAQKQRDKATAAA